MSPSLSTITTLVDDLSPVKPLSTINGLVNSLAAAALSVTCVIGSLGIREGIANGDFNPVHLIGAGQFLIMGLITSTMVIAMGRPYIGIRHGNVLWLGAPLTLLPTIAIVTQLFDHGDALSGHSVEAGILCLLRGSAFSVFVFASLVWWLRQGAPTMPNRAGWLSGLAAGSFGIFALSLHCGSNEITHIGIWHSAAVLGMACVGRLVVPPLVHW